MAQSINSSPHSNFGGRSGIQMTRGKREFPSFPGKTLAAKLIQSEGEGGESAPEAFLRESEPIYLPRRRRLRR